MIKILFILTVTTLFSACGIKENGKNYTHQQKMDSLVIAIMSLNSYDYSEDTLIYLVSDLFAPEKEYHINDSIIVKTVSKEPENIKMFSRINIERYDYRADSLKLRIEFRYDNYCEYASETDAHMRYWEDSLRWGCLISETSQECLKAPGYIPPCDSAIFATPPTEKISYEDLQRILKNRDSIENKKDK